MPQPPIDLTQSPDWVFPLLMFCLGIFFVTVVMRRAVEIYVPGFAARNQWKKVWLPSLPVIAGGIAAAIMSRYPYLSSLPTWGTRAFYGCVAGGLSSFMYKVFQAVIQAKFGVKVGVSNPPDQNMVETLPPSANPRTSGLPKVRGTGYSNPDSLDEYSDTSTRTLPPEKKP